MAATTDRARFYLEQYVPELREFESKGIFTRDEISAITSKRSDFEHILNARGSTPADYARYATYEMNLDALRKKRCRRLGVKGTKEFSGQRTVFFVLERATKKFPGDMGLWMQFINFCKKEKANKKLAKVFTSVLRLHPREWNLWVLAAKHYAETQGDMGTARSYMQRGLRFCKSERKLWLEYAKLEMVYLAKLAARRKILGLDEKREEKKIEDDENEMKLPEITANDFEHDEMQGVEEVNADLLKRLKDAPAFTGGIPTAIFDAAMNSFKDKTLEVAEDFYNLVAAFDQVPSTSKILQHILDHLCKTGANSVETIICEAKHAVFAIDAQSAEFPLALGMSLSNIKSGISEMTEKERPRLADKAVSFLLPFLRSAEDLDVDVVKVLELSVKRYLRILEQSPKKPGKPAPRDALMKRLQNDGRESDLETVAQLTAG